jgi:hypothetical protein
MNITPFILVKGIDSLVALSSLVMFIHLGCMMMVSFWFYYITLRYLFFSLCPSKVCASRYPDILIMQSE